MSTEVKCSRCKKKVSTDWYWFKNIRCHKNEDEYSETDWYVVDRDFHLCQDCYDQVIGNYR